MSLVGAVNSFDDLPDSPSIGDKWKVSGNAETGFITYFVVRSPDAVWDETVVDGLENVIDATTMPHALIRQADGSFLFTPFTWTNRRVGDDFTNPKPGFIGRNINGVFFYQNRLAFLYDENVIASCSGEFGNFWRTTVLDYLDSDVVDFAASGNKVSILRDAIPYPDGVILTSDQTQFSMTNGESGVSPSSVAIRAVTNYDVEPGSSPVALNSEVYFASGQASHSLVYEYTRNADTDALTAANITAHVSRYIPSGVSKIIPAADQNALFVLTDGAPNSVFVYQFYWLTNDSKAQSAWHRWDFSEEVSIQSGTYIDGVLYLVLQRSDGLYLEKVGLEYGVPTPGSPVQLYLDSLTTPSGTYNSGTNKTTFTLPYAVEDVDALKLLYTAGPDFLKEVTLSRTLSTPTTLEVTGDVSTFPLFVGYSYAFRYRFSRPYLRRADGTAVASGRLQLRTLTVNFRDTTNFRWEVWPYGLGEGTPIEGAYTGWELGDFAPGSPQLQKGRHPIQVYCNADTGVVEIINDSIFGSSFQAAEWEAFYYNRSRG